MLFWDTVWFTVVFCLLLVLNIQPMVFGMMMTLCFGLARAEFKSMLYGLLLKSSCTTAMCKYG